MEEDFQSRLHWHNESTFCKNRNFLVQCNQQDNKVRKEKENLTKMLEQELETNLHKIDRSLDLSNYSIDTCYQKATHFHNLNDSDPKLHFDSKDIAYSQKLPCIQYDRLGNNLQLEKIPVTQWEVTQLASLLEGRLVVQLGLLVVTNNHSSAQSQHLLSWTMLH